jgi:hypothetical protein
MQSCAQLFGAPGTRMFRIAFAFLTVVALFGCAAREAVQPPANPRAIAVLVSTDPWLMVVGSDTPRFALYDDGYVIYAQQTSEDDYVHMVARLTPSQLAGVKAKLLAFTADPVPKQVNLRPGWTDQPETHIALDVDGHKLVTYIYGGLGPVDELDTGTLRKPDHADPLPAQVEGLIEYLSEFRVANAQPWVPEQLEVMLWDYSYAPEASIQWPSKWPGLSAPTTRKRGDAYSVFLPGTEEEALIALLATRNEKGAVEVDGKKWAVSYRRVFPRWREAFRE